MNLNQMTRIAKKSQHKHYQHCSLIYAGSRLLAYGYNTKDKHAEIVALGRLEAIFRTQNSRKPRNLHMVNLMIKKRSGNFGNSYPCDNCYVRSVSSGVRIITIYSEKEGFRQTWTSS